MSNMSKSLANAKKGGDTWPMILESKLNKLYYVSTEHESRYGLHASAILASDNEFCYREQILSLFYKMNQGEQLPVGTLRIFATGNALHEKWYQLFRRANIDVAIERSLFLKEFDLSFTIDALLDFTKPKILEEYGEYTEGEGGEELVCDVKSMNSFAFRKNPNHPSGEKQVNFYLWALSRYTGRPHKRGFVLRDSKDDSKFSCVPVYYDKEKVRPYYNRLKEIQELKKEFMQSGELPIRRCKNCDVKRAASCSMRDACWKIGMGRVKLPKELQPFWEKKKN